MAGFQEGRHRNVTGTTFALPPIGDAENLGRQMFSTKQAKRAQNTGLIEIRVFEARINDDDVSVDRLDHAPLEEMAVFGDREAASRERQFHGWATLPKSKASEDGRSVQADPTLDNPYHSVIVLNPPADVDRRKHERRTHAISLAKHSTFWPKSPSYRVA